MSEGQYSGLTVSQLVARFAAMAIEQDEAEKDSAMGDIAKINRLFVQMQTVAEELKNRPGDQRRALLPLFGHPNMQVRLKAAKATLAVAPQEARQALESIAASRWYPQAGDAGMCLWALDEGIFVPD
ncbi:MAG TPA: DUF2019 domain-containing protein [Roseiarcus sp.]|nr:DUF2019 domain-containing protein [Roseiarcus sp.]